MHYQTLISTTELEKNLSDPDWAIIDCRFSLLDPERGRRDYLLSHVPGAVYAHLDADLSAEVKPGITGRHPLPRPDQFVERLEGWGIGNSTQVVVYDDALGATAARLWWMLNWLGHQKVALLDGGWNLWREEGRPLQSRVAGRPRRDFTPVVRSALLATTRDVESICLDPKYRLIDARDSVRYAGEQESIDPVAGHIPGAVSLPYAGNLDSSGRYLQPDELRERYAPLLGSTPVEQVVCYCGSGVTAAHNLIAIAHAGFGYAKLYAGSWSEWITAPERPIGVGS